MGFTFVGRKGTTRSPGDGTEKLLFRAEEPH